MDKSSFQSELQCVFGKPVDFYRAVDAEFIIKIAVTVHIKIDQVFRLAAFLRNGDVKISSSLVPVHFGEKQKHVGGIPEPPCMIFTRICSKAL